MKREVENVVVGLFVFQWKLSLRKKSSAYKNTDQQEFAQEKVCVEFPSSKISILLNHCQTFLTVCAENMVVNQEDKISVNDSLYCCRCLFSCTCEAFASQCHLSQEKGI